jgi:hypothetical protein
MKKIYTLALLISVSQLKTLAQNVGINSTGATPSASSMLDVESTNKGVLIPRIALTDATDVATIASPATSLLIYNTATAGASPSNVVPGYYYWDGAKWQSFGGSGGKNWSLLGNAGTVAATNFMGTTDNVDVVFKRNNIRSGLLGLTNTSFGYNTLIAVTGTQNVAMGAFSLASAVAASSNVAVGYQALNLNVSNNNNTAVGFNALRKATANNNTGVGSSALENTTTGANNTAVGYQSLLTNITGDNNTATGYGALNFSTTNDNTANGYFALNKNAAGAQNTALGSKALEANVAGNNNTAVGYQALNANGQGSVTPAQGTGNTAVGFNASSDNRLGTTNTAVGAYSLSKNTVTGNTSVGYNALNNNTTGANNVALGNAAGLINTTGSFNTFIGSGANATAINFSKAVAIGYNAQVGASNALVLGGTGVDAVKVGIGTASPVATLDIVGDPSTATVVDGVIAPRLTGAELKAKDAIYTTTQAGAIVYITLPLTAVTTTAKTENVTAVGYYYFDGTIWQDFVRNVLFDANLGTGAGGTTNATIAATGFNTVPLPVVSKNIGGGIWNATSNTYEIPVSGTYLIKSSIRLVDGSSSRNVFQAVNLSNIDVAEGIWGTNSGNRWTMLYNRIAYFTKGDLLRLYIYSDGAIAYLSDASLNVVLIGR